MPQQPRRVQPHANASTFPISESGTAQPMAASFCSNSSSTSSTTFACSESVNFVQSGPAASMSEQPTSHEEASSRLIGSQSNPLAEASSHLYPSKTVGGIAEHLHATPIDSGNLTCHSLRLDGHEGPPSRTWNLSISAPHAFLQPNPPYQALDAACLCCFNSLEAFSQDLNDNPAEYSVSFVESHNGTAIKPQFSVHSALSDAPQAINGCQSFSASRANGNHVQFIAAHCPEQQLPTGPEYEVPIAGPSGMEYDLGFVGAWAADAALRGEIKLFYNSPFRVLVSATSLPGSLKLSSQPSPTCREPVYRYTREEVMHSDLNASSFRSVRNRLNQTPGVPATCVRYSPPNLHPVDRNSVIGNNQYMSSQSAIPEEVNARHHEPALVAVPIPCNFIDSPTPTSAIATSSLASYSPLRHLPAKAHFERALPAVAVSLLTYSLHSFEEIESVPSQPSHGKPSSTASSQITHSNPPTTPSRDDRHRFSVSYKDENGAPKDGSYEPGQLQGSHRSRSVKSQDSACLAWELSLSHCDCIHEGVYNSAQHTSQNTIDMGDGGMYTKMEYDLGFVGAWTEGEER
ncbi:hypothetical protein BJ508DRAFT_327395 [Ascobolus immersus RN42]|uniref:Uncharacterized protein n=1 Tax=Ascobolus immersus RN42 TaxID=1160509 RepID=A0A3N4I837_ASCIM|nr:hypothetical protein BJ508DRAFT_327395 [Ascobolus immersus RN42]